MEQKLGEIPFVGRSKGEKRGGVCPEFRRLNAAWAWIREETEKAILRRRRGWDLKFLDFRSVRISSSLSWPYPYSTPLSNPICYVSLSQAWARLLGGRERWKNTLATVRWDLGLLLVFFCFVCLFERQDLSRLVTKGVAFFCVKRTVLMLPKNRIWPSYPASSD